jgi:hypothetical protein
MSPLNNLRFCIQKECRGFFAGYFHEEHFFGFYQDPRSLMKSCSSSALLRTCCWTSEIFSEDMTINSEQNFSHNQVTIKLGNGKKWILKKLLFWFLHSQLSTYDQCCQMVCFQTKNPKIWVNFGGPCIGKCLYIL